MSERSAPLLARMCVKGGAGLRAAQWDDVGVSHF